MSRRRRGGPRHGFEVAASTSAPPAAVWALLTDAATWPTWSPIDSLEHDRSSGLDADGHDEVGAVRVFRTGRTVSGERLTELRPGRLMAYEDAFNPVMCNYDARIELTATASGGTRIRWGGRYDTSWIAGLYLPRYLRRFMQKMADGLAIAAAERAAPEPQGSS